MADSPRTPWWYVPTLYVAEGLPYFLVTEVATAFYTKAGVENDVMSFWTSLLLWAWTAKPLWAPLIERFGTRRTWVLATEALLIVATTAVAAMLPSHSFFALTIVGLGVVAVLSATHDAAADGWYLLALDKPAQELFSGIRSTFYRLARVIANGFVVWLAGRLEGSFGEHDALRRPWVYALLALAAIQLLALIWNWATMPPVATDQPRAPEDKDAPGVIESWTAFFRQPGIGWIVAFVLFFRFPEQMVTKLATPFLLGDAAKGGLALPTEAVGLLTGVLGVAFLVVGGIGGGALIERFGLRRCAIPLVLVMHAPNLLYLAASILRPGPLGASVVVAVEQLGYGFGMSAYTVAILHAARGTRTPTSSYAVATGLMAFGAFLAGSMSGFVQVRIGYPEFFALVCVLAIPAAVPLFAITAREPSR